LSSAVRANRYQVFSLSQATMQTNATLVPDPAVRKRTPTSETRTTQQLFEEYARTRDVELRNRLVLMHERLAKSIAARFGKSGGNSEEDLRQSAWSWSWDARPRFPSWRKPPA
jgi:hypothetical protein